MSQAEFDKAAEDVKKLSKEPSDDDKLKLYGLFKRKIFFRISKVIFMNDVFSFLFLSSEVTVGENTTSKPGMFDMKGKYKWEAWEANKGKSKEAARQEYIDLVKKLQG